MTFYRCIEKRYSKSFLPHFSTFVEIVLKSCRTKVKKYSNDQELLAYVCELSCINFFIGFQNVGL